MLLNQSNDGLTSRARIYRNNVATGITIVTLHFTSLHFTVRGAVTKSRWVVTVLLTVAACYAAYSAGVALGPQSPGRQAATAPHAASQQQINGLEVDAADLDFGEAWESPDFVRTLTVRNTGAHAVAVKDMQGGCECTAVEPAAFVVAPGGEQRVAVKIDLTHRFPHHFGVERRELAISVRPTFAGRGVAAESWAVRGVVKSRVSVDGRALEFGDLCGQGGPAVTRAMKATAHVPLAALEATAPADKATVSVAPAPKRPGGYDVRVTPNPDLPLGAFQFDVRLTATTPDGAKHKCVAFRVQGEMRSPVRVIPDQMLLGEHATGTTTEAVVSVKLPATRWTVERVETERTDTSVTDVPPLDGHPTYRIAQLIANPGDHSAQVRFVCRKPNGQLETVLATVRWFGEAAPKGDS